MPAQVVSALERPGRAHLIDLSTLMTYDTENQLLLDDKTIDMIVTRSGLTIDTYILEPTVKSAQAIKALQAAISSLSQQMMTVQAHVLYNDGASTFQSLGFVFLSFLSFFFRIRHLRDDPGARARGRNAGKAFNDARQALAGDDRLHPGLRGVRGSSSLCWWWCLCCSFCSCPARGMSG